MPNSKGLEGIFDIAVAEYEKMRPTYADKLYADIFEYRCVDDKSTVAEIGIGGGQATLPFLLKGCKLTAIEYGKNFCDLCRGKFAFFDGFNVINTRFENYSAKPCSFDMVYSATAFHWIPENIGYTKVFDMLKSGGVFARFANHPYIDKGRVELSECLRKLYAIYMPQSPLKKEYGAADAANIADTAIKYGFINVCYRLYTRTRDFTSDAYIALLGTYSNHLALEEKVRQEFFAKIKSAIDSYGGIITIYDTMDLELATKP